MRTKALFILCTLLAAGAAQAGTMGVAWDPVGDADLAGYKVYYGTATGNYTQSVTLPGTGTSTTLTGLDACTRYYVAVKAYDTGNLESAAYSNEVVGLPRPVLNSVTPASGEQGRSMTLTLAGESYDTGASVSFSGTGITVTATRRDACGQLSVDITIDIAAATGARDVTVMNPDRSFGTKAAGFTVSANAAPTVSSTSPVAGATGVAVNVWPTVVFSETMGAASITPSTVRLIDASGAAVAQAAGSPTLGADLKTVTIKPAANLGYSKTYRIAVTGGSSGVKDATGVAMSADWTQTPGFTTGSAPDTTAPTVSSTSPADGATGVLVTVKPTVTFSEAMDPASITSSTVRLLDPSGSPVAQAAGSPALSADRKTATITPAANLGEVKVYKIQVVGGASGAKDAAGNALATTWTQTSGFTTENRPPGTVTNARRSDTR